MRFLFLSARSRTCSRRLADPVALLRLDRHSDHDWFGLMTPRSAAATRGSTRLRRKVLARRSGRSRSSGNPAQRPPSGSGMDGGVADRDRARRARRGSGAHRRRRRFGASPDPARMALPRRPVLKEDADRRSPSSPIPPSASCLSIVEEGLEILVEGELLPAACSSASPCARWPRDRPWTERASFDNDEAMAVLSAPTSISA